MGTKRPDPPQMIELDDSTKKLINEREARAMRPEGDFAKELNDPIDQAQIAMKEIPGQVDVNSPFHGAMRKVYAQKAQKEIDRLKAYTQPQAQTNKANALNQVSAQQIAQMRARTQNYEFLTQAYNQQEAAKANLINNLFQIGATAMTYGKLNGKKDPLELKSQATGAFAPTGYGPDFSNMG